MEWIIYPGIFVISFLEYWLSTLRINAVNKKDRKVAGLVAFIEEVFGFIVLYLAIAEQNIFIILFSALGGVAGIIFSMRD